MLIIIAASSLGLKIVGVPSFSFYSADNTASAEFSRVISSTEQIWGFLIINIV